MNHFKNRIQLLGNLGKDPEVKLLDSGKKRVSFSIATSEQFRDSKGESQVETQWHQVVAWGKIADVAEQHLSKGKEVLIEGKAVNRSYTSEKGETRYVSEVVLNSLLLLGKKD